MTPGPRWSSLADALQLDGERLLFAPAGRAAELVTAAAAAGYRVVEIDTDGAAGFRAAQAAIAEALHLPETAGRNLDALADSLGDLARYCPDAERVALFWHHPEQVIANDTAGWFRLADVLEDASSRLWRGGEPDDRLFETVLLVSGFDE